LLGDNRCRRKIAIHQETELQTFTEKQLLYQMIYLNEASKDDFAFEKIGE
jgi:hypothetical protein